MIQRLLQLGLAMTLSSTALAEISLKQDVVPILNQHCVMCHITGAALAGLELYTDPWHALVGVKSAQSPLALVVPNEPEKSYFFLKLTDKYMAAGGTGLQMPIQQEALTPKQLEVIRTWIEQGAPNN